MMCTFIKIEYFLVKVLRYSLDFQSSIYIYTKLYVGEKRNGRGKTNG